MKNLTNYIGEGNIKNIERIFRNFIDTIRIHDIKITPEEITVSATPKGNWQVYRNDKKLCIVSGKLLTDEVIDKYNLMNHNIDENKEEYVSAINEEKISIFDLCNNIDGEIIKDLKNPKKLMLELENNFNNSLEKFLKKEIKPIKRIYSDFKLSGSNDESIIITVKLHSDDIISNTILSYLFKSGMLVSNDVPVTIMNLGDEIRISKYIIFTLNMKFETIETGSADYNSFYINPENSKSNTIYYDVENNTWGYVK